MVCPLVVRSTDESPLAISEGRPYPSWPCGRARPNCRRFSLLDGLQAGFTNFAVFVGHVGFGYFSAAITDHGLSYALLFAVQSAACCGRTGRRVFSLCLHRKQDQQ